MEYTAYYGVTDMRPELELLAVFDDARYSDAHGYGGEPLSSSPSVEAHNGAEPVLFLERTHH
jgi:hypothetical protein